MPDKPAAARAKPKTTTLDAWKKNKTHPGITLPSGAVVTIQIPDLPNLVKAGQIPNELIDIAIGVVAGKKITRDDIEQQAEFYNLLASWTVVEPEVPVEAFQSGDLPFEDKEMLIAFATRQEDFDAVGHHIAGLERLKSFREARGIIRFDEDLEDD